MQNEMMHRPVVKAELVDYMRSQQKSLTGKLNIIEKDANKRG
ncbi:MAG: O-methyltransferase, partial [Tetragenococcus halophilus]|nr:O-methyltransferase [Tetragenococcus halophilus]